MTPNPSLERTSTGKRLVSAHERSFCEFTKIYGVPARSLMPKDRKGYSYLVYDLVEGYKLLVHVPSISDSRFAAAQQRR